VGTTAGGPVPATSAATNIADGRGPALRDARGALVRSRLREAPLLQIAAQTGAQYVALNDRENGLPTLLARLRALPPAEASRAAGRTVAVADNRYRYPLGAALVLLLLDSLLTVRVLRIRQLS